jgi:crotonobetainyl-CoA:carnitine CoA-transferase CaiB-like acyl-CoA transferase
VTPAPQPDAAPAFLDGLRVLETGDGVAGSYATSVLGGFGAHVTKVVDPATPVHRLRPALADGTSLLASVLDDGKETVGADPGGEFDVVVCDRVTSGPDPDGYLASVAARNRRAWVTISAAGLSGPRRRAFGTELTVAAAGGLLSAASDPSTGQPLKLAGCQALLSAGQVAALAACHALDRSRRDGPVHLDVSAQEAALVTGPVLRVVHALLNCTGDAGARRYGAPAGFYPCSDGVLRISAMEDHQWEGLVRALGAPAWAEPYGSTGARTEHAQEIDAQLAAVTATRAKRDLEEALQANGVPATAMYSPEEILASAHYAARRSWRAVDVSGTRVTVMGTPVRTVAHAEPPAPSPATGLAGAKIAEAGHVLAVPLAGALLGAMGAQVTKLEDPARMDMYRRRGPFIDSTPGTERAAYFAAVNHSKRSRTVSLDDARGVEDAIDGADVVVENFGPGRARRLGVDAARLATAHPALLAFSSSGFGHDGPWSSYRAYAYNLQTSCGLGYLTRTASGAPVEIDMAWADLVSGFAIATIVAAWAAGPGGRVGAGLDFSMAELITSRFNEFLAAASVGVHTTDRGNDQYPYAPCGVYPAGGDWIALAVDGDAEWAATARVLGIEPGATGADARYERREALDAEIGRVTSGRDARALVRALEDAGVAAAVVETAPTLITDAHLAERGFFVEVSHPDWGARRLIGLPWRVAGEAPFALTPPPLLEGAPAGAER